MNIHYRIRVKNLLDEYWGHWFGAMHVSHLDNGESELIGLVEDQEQLYHILEKVRDLNLVLLSVEKVGDNSGYPQMFFKTREGMKVKTYEIRVSGSRSRLMQDPLEGLNIAFLGDSDFLLTARLNDPPALYGLLDRLHAAKFVLISLHCLSDPSQEIDHGDEEKSIG